MGALFRSEEMALCQLFIQPEAAYSSVSMLGELGIVQFRDLNANVNMFLRKYVGEVRRCDELERKLRYIEAAVRENGIALPDPQVVPKAPNPREIIDLEANLEKTENEIVQLSQNAVNLKSNFVELQELRHVLEKAQVFLTEQEESDSSRALIGGDDRGRLGFIAGVIQRERVPGFERMLWRVSRGNVFLRQAELDELIEDPATGNKFHKTVFVVFFQGENLKARVKKVCAGFHASTYHCPSSAAERKEKLAQIRTQLEDLNMVLNQTQDHRHRVLLSVGKEVTKWMVMVRKTKAIYHTLNMFNMDVTKKCQIGECWVPYADLGLVRDALADGGKAVGSSIQSFVNIIETAENPPTFIRTNKFTAGFQALVDAYAVTSYREVNPALYTIVTFPFLFAVMFGDLGHGLIVTLFAAYLCIWEKKLSQVKGGGEIWTIFFGGRYIILMMGVFSIYTGLIYNDVFSLSMNIFGSSWNATRIAHDPIIDSSRHVTMDPATEDYAQAPYVMGLDPVWQTATNKIIFLNSFKMKISIIIGVVHMVFGVMMSLINHVQNRKYISIITEFVPQMLFLLLLFGYMAVMMLMKWILYWPTQDPSEFKSSPTCAPSVLITFINMMLFGDNPEAFTCDPYMFPDQKSVQRILVLAALACIPVMLLGKPIAILLTRRKPKYDVRSRSNGDAVQGIELQSAEVLAEEAQEVLGAPQDGGHDEHDDEPFSEIMVHQCIHTVEYVLSTVSHTASYLRLWALSLAHAQLSDVLWSMIFRKGIMAGQSEHDDGSVGSMVLGGVFIYLAFGIWTFFTVSVLVLMEGLSAFLHTLRLHWVEFMSKFYVGAGYAFQPFAFNNILEPSAEDD
ncbi:V-type proton ATPase 116 kDa subunit a 1 isoform X2 [Frankliniella occidentalis]|uniref:V-type proton ATPase subunit a n=1 Tax=Frankliniella occidentalis TaxID=133901 RepID=A0A9C6U599_FRAOC|nr:V-type proton ATPase 116 kDa subunit a 1 isoform X2 [Frankliniella occidentalis]